MTKYELYLKPSMVWDNNLNYKVENSRGVSGFLINNLNLVNRDREVLIIFALNAKGDIIGMNEASIGELSSTVVHPREVAKFLVLSNAAAAIVAHNHPSGDATPSDGDLLATERLVDMGKVIGIKLIDHIIVGENGYYSMDEHGITQEMNKDD